MSQRSSPGTGRWRVLFLVNGLGLGNSSRCHAVIQQLAEADAEIELVTSDNGCWYFDGRPEIARLTVIPALRYGARDGHISIAATLAKLGHLVAALRDADRIIAAVVARFRPHVVVADSVYSLRAVRRAGCAVAALNNSDMVVRGMGRFRDWPVNLLPQFACVEFADFLYHRTVPDLVISPRLDGADGAEGASFRRVGPIVRGECRPSEPTDQPPRRVAIMLSGSAFGSQVRLVRQHPGLRIDVIGRQAPERGMPQDNVTFHGKLRDSLPLIAAADLLVVNGGFSAISEAVFLRKPVVVIPVPRHSEQWINGRTITALGLGMMAGQDRLEEAMEQALGRIDAFRAAYRALPVADNGAVRAAELILELAERMRP